MDQGNKQVYTRQEELRYEIDAVDSELQRLINRRASLVLEVGRLKEATGESFYQPARETWILDQVVERNTGPLSDEAMIRLFRELISSCLALEQRLCIAYLGPEASFSHSAVLLQFGHSVEGCPVRTIREVFREVQADRADYGVVPMENSNQGSINSTLDQLMHSDLQICGEVALRIEHHLMSLAPNLLDIERLYIHPQTRAQCREWLAEHLPDLELVEVTSNGEAARLSADDPRGGAIAGEVAARRYRLPILVRGVEDDPDNTTRFVVIGTEIAQASGRDKTSVLVSGPNHPGSLLHMLKPFADAGVNLTKIVSRPTYGALWDYVFFLDMEGHCEEPTVSRALTEIQQQGIGVRMLGSYPRARGC